MNLPRLAALVCALVSTVGVARAQTQSTTQGAPSDASPAASTPSAQTSPGASTTQSTTNSYNIEIDGTKQWVDTNIDLHAGEKIHVTATGTVTYAAQSSKQKARSFGPGGLTRSFADLVHQYAVTDAGHGALIGRLGAADAGGQPFLVGASSDFEAPVANRLFLGINQSQKDGQSASGNFQVTIEVVSQGTTAGADAAVGGPAETRIAGITPDLLSEIPRRVSDQQGNAGDMVNVLLLGTEDQVVATFKAAGWVHVDSSVGDTVLAGLVDSLEKKDYLTMPMSTLYLFKRPQDYGFAHAEPVRVVMSRNHLRVWKSPYTANGKTVWCIAATHDIGFERDQRNNSVTHKIDPAIDGEREYVNNTLTGTGLVEARDHVTPSDALTTAKTATGGEFHSDGRILVLVLKSAAAGSD
ncbi:MAG TPA: LssY C-terminal domain-containing protein [Verrucomicrobiae bacterium]|nr:LssY C-terminal domain-containing protein [Verrucomicrobiae bacterium]